MAMGRDRALRPCLGNRPDGPVCSMVRRHRDFVRRIGEVERAEVTNMSATRYDDIGVLYSRYRRGDPRTADLVASAIGHAQSIVDVGAGTGSYEPENRKVVAVEPSEVMIRQRSAESGPIVRAVAEALPFSDKRFDAAMALTGVN